LTLSLGSSRDTPQRPSVASNLTGKAATRNTDLIKAPDNTYLPQSEHLDLSMLGSLSPAGTTVSEQTQKDREIV
jgi:hypothetical protein